VLRRLDTHGIAAITCQPPTLEELFLSQYRDQVTATGDAPKEEVRA
jgi:ABC-2 type transport system ATP-binding protein